LRVAVIGAGLFGCTAAIFAARAGHEVHLFDSAPDIMQGASGHSFYRLHRGYHYPRSFETAVECMLAESGFRSEFGQAIIDGGQQFYVVDESGHISGPDFAQYTRDLSLDYMRELDHPLINAEWIFNVAEPRVDVEVLKSLLHTKLFNERVTLNLQFSMPPDVRDKFDIIVVATYSRMNETLDQLGVLGEPYKFQYVERPIVRLPDEFKDTSIVVIDGPFGCIDPLGATGLHILGHVTKAVHVGNVGMMADYPPDAQVAPESRFGEIVQALSKYVPGVSKAEHVSSSFTVRAVLPHVERTDERPTLVRQHDGQVLSVFSGKLGTATDAARGIVHALNGMRRRAA
jgi:hypothetical protein